MTNLNIAKLYLATNATATAAEIDAAIADGSAATAANALTGTVLINAIYQAAFGRDADAEGLAYWGASTATGDALITAITGGAATYVENPDYPENVAIAAADTVKAVAKATADAAAGTLALGATVVAIVSVVDAATAATAVTTITNAVATAEEAASIDGETTALTASDDTVVGTALNDLIDGSVKNTLGNSDVILDSTSTDADILNATVTTNSGTARIQNIETINILGEYVTTGLDVTNVSNATTLNLDSKIVSGAATASNLNSLNVSNVVAGDNIATLTVSSSAVGTRDTIYADANAATTVNVTGNAGGVDTYDVTVADATALTLSTFTTVDTVTVNTAGSTLDLTGVATLGTLNINNSADLAVSVTTAVADDTIITGSGDTTVTTTGAILDGLSMSNTGSGALTVSLGTTLTGEDFKEIVADNLNFTADFGGAVAITVNENSQIDLVGDVAASGAATIELENVTGDITTGTLLLNVSQDQTASITTGSNVDTLLISATPDEATDTDSNSDGFDNTHITLGTLTLNAATATVVAIGSSDLEFTSLVNAADVVVTSTTMTGDLTIGSVDTDGNGAQTFDVTVLAGSGDDSIAVNADDTTTALVLGGYGDDTLSATDAGTDANNAATDYSTIKLYGEAGDDTISATVAVDANNADVVVLDGGAGNDIITGSAAVDTIVGGTGDDVINGGASADTISTGTGSDIVTIASGEDGDTISDFTTGTDTLVLTGAGVNIDVTTLTAPSATGAYTNLDATANFDVTLTGVSATDLSDSIQLGSINATTGAKSAYAVTQAENSTATITVIAGDKSDVISVAMTTDNNNTDASATNITTGTGSDTIVLNATEDGNDTNTVTVTDFTTGTDKIILEGTADAALDLTAVTVATGVLDLAAFDVTLNNASAAVYANGSTDVSAAVQLGSVDAAFTMAGVADYTGGSFDDVVAFEAGANANTYNFIDNGGVDTLTELVLTSDFVSFTGMTGITGTGVAVAANATKITDGTDGEVYVFASAADGTGSEAITTFTENAATGVTADTILADVAAFLEAGLGEADGESYVAVINDGTTKAYAYFVEGDADGIDAANLTLLGSIDASTAAAITATQIA